MYARTNTHTYTRTYWTAVWFLFGVNNTQFKKFFGYRSHHICTQNSTYSQDLISFMTFLKPL